MKHQALMLVLLAITGAMLVAGLSMVEKANALTVSNTESVLLVRMEGMEGMEEMERMEKTQMVVLLLQ